MAKFGKYIWRKLLWVLRFLSAGFFFLWKKRDSWLKLVRVLFEFIIIIVMVLSLRTSNKSLDIAHKANEMTRQSLRSGYVPWPKVEALSIVKRGDAFFDFNFRLKNHSHSGPALALTMRSITPIILNETLSYKTDVLMPEGEGMHTLIVTGTENQAIIDNIQNGILPIRVVIAFSDIFGTQYAFEQEFRKIEDQFRIIEYLPKGLAESLESIKEK